MKLLIQIPCYNEAKSLPLLCQSLPRSVNGFDSVEWVVINDGSSDRTAEVARECGVDHVVDHPTNQGLAKAFMTGLGFCLEHGADVIVNTDADNQYDSRDIEALVRPVVEGKANFVVGERPISSIREFSLLKRVLQRIGSWVVRVVSGTSVPDAPSGFRAFSRDAAKRMMVYSDYTYTLETIIQAGLSDMAVASVPVRVNPSVRRSRLVKSVFSYVWKSIFTIARIFVVYRPFAFFGSIGLGLMVSGFLIGLRFLCYYFFGDGEGKVQSLILASMLMGMGFQTVLIAFLADLVSANRKLIERLRVMMMKD